MSVAVASHQRTRKINLRLLKKIIRELLAELALKKVEIGICLVGAMEMIQLNERFLKHKGSTDVIAFDYGDNGRAGSPLPADGAHGATRPTLHGEIFICVDEAVLHARKFGTSWQSEVTRYLIHGVLHLAGFDDLNAVARRKMKQEENRLLREIIRRFPLSKL